MTRAIDQQSSNQDNVALLEKVVIQGDLEQLSPAERINYYRQICESLGLNPLTRPFEYIKLQGRMTLYAKKDATEQLAAQHNISISINDTQDLDGVYVVQARASQEGRYADATGAVPIEGLKGEAKANALMKAETKASRRSVLRLVGLGWLDETEIESIPGVMAVNVDHETGAIANQASATNDPAIEAGSWESLRAHVESLGWDWDSFTQDVLGMSQADFEKLGGTPKTAWKRYTNYDGKGSNTAKT